MSKTAKLILDGKEHELDVIVGSENEHAVDIRNLRSKTGYITLDSGYGNTGSTTSAITYLDGEAGVLRYRGIPIEQLAEHSSFIETAYLLMYGKLPTQAELAGFRAALDEHNLVPETLRGVFAALPATSHPMAVLSSTVCALSAYFPACLDPGADFEPDIFRLMGMLPALAAYGYRYSRDLPVVYPKSGIEYCANFLQMMFASPGTAYEPHPVVVKALDTLLILHADHEQNCSTSTVRIVGSSNANLYASVSAGIDALWGPLHGGANQAVIEMLEDIRDSGGDYKTFMSQIKDKTSNKRLMGFGHRVYKNYDPRAKILKKMADGILDVLGVKDPLLDIAKNLEQIALSDDFFVERKLYPNVDFYSGVVYKALGIPTNMFTVMFAIGRLPGWIAHWREMRLDPSQRIGRPRQVYTGENERSYTPMGERS